MDGLEKIGFVLSIISIIYIVGWVFNYTSLFFGGLLGGLKFLVSLFFLYLSILVLWYNFYEKDRFYDEHISYFQQLTHIIVGDFSDFVEKLRKIKSI